MVGSKPDAAEPGPSSKEKVATAGDAQGVAVPHEQAVEGTSEEASAPDRSRVEPDQPDSDEINRGGRSF
jgi:hypothetical protein